MDFKFSGADYQPTLDKERLTGQILRVFNAMKDGHWRTVQEIKEKIKIDTTFEDPENSIQAQLRNLRKKSFGGYIIERRRRGEPKKGICEYKLNTLN